MKSMKLHLLGAIAGAVVAGLAITQAQAETVTLRYSNWLPLNYPLNEGVMIPWIEEVEKVTEGRVRIEMTPKVVGTVPGQYDVVADGLADISLFLPGYAPGRFPLIDGLELSFLGNDPTKRCPATWEAYEQFIAPLDIFKDVQVLSVYCSNSGQFVMTNKALTSVEDFNGMKIRTPHPAISEALELLGAVPVSKPASEVYELASGGIIDGAVFPLDSTTGFKLEGVMKKVTLVPGGISNTMVLISVNKDAWAKVSEADQKAILAVSEGALAERTGKNLEKVDAEAREALKNAGAEFNTLSEEAVEQIKQKIAPVRERWIAKAKEAGLDNPEAMLDFVQTRSH